VATKEQITATKHEQTADVEQFGELAHERHEAIRAHLDASEHHHKRIEDQEAALEQATELAGKADAKKEAHKHTSPVERRKGAPTKKQRARAFDTKMKEVQSEMRPSERVVSKLIHAKPVEQASDFVGSTLARPNAMLSGSIAAFIGVTVFYFIAKYYGYHLSGFETIGAFVLGWIIGILYDYFSVMIRGHKR
jgi:hypothetical protein